MKLLIFGGSGFVGSAVARKAVARGWSVTSVSRSGKAFATPAGHAPAWVSSVDWRQGSAFNPESYERLMEDSDAVVTTLGALFEQEYKEQGVASPLRVLKSVLENAAGSRGNPLQQGRGERSYERLNRDSAIPLFRSFASTRTACSSSASPSPSSNPFVYISAEDIFRPFVPARYIQSKRQAEEEISRIAAELANGQGESAGLAGTRTRPVFVRPSLMYHPHLNPPSTLPATLLEATSKLHALVPPSLHLFPSTASSIPSSALPPAAASFASLLAIPPIHVDAVGDAVCKAIEDETVSGVVGVKEMRAMLGLGRPESWKDEPATQA
ncbi:hypothetical protein JCM10213_007809 [Rhodosporidiobolus nylandii]